MHWTNCVNKYLKAMIKPSILHLVPIRRKVMSVLRVSIQGKISQFELLATPLFFVKKEEREKLRLDKIPTFSAIN